MKVKIYALEFSLTLLALFCLPAGIEGASEDQGWRLLEDGKALYTRLQFADAEKKLAEALSTFEATTDKAGVAQAAEQLGRVNYERGSYPQAIALYDKALSAFIGNSPTSDL